MNSKAVYLWASEALAQFIEGAADSFLIVTGGSIAAQVGATALPAVTPKQLLLSILTGGAIYVASWLKKNRMPTALAPAATVASPTPATQ